jgi:hypothetical protein
LARVRVRRGVGHHRRPVLEDGRGAQARVSADLVDVEAVVGLEPDAVLVDDAHDRDEDVEEPGGEGARSKAPSGGVSRMS